MTMNRYKALGMSLLAMVVMAAVPAAYAQNTRSWVASFGSDLNDCTRPSPCRTFGRAIAVSNAGAEVVVMDSAGYGPFTIDKAITIVAPAGVHAAIAPTTGNAITINSGITGAVILRGLYLNGQGASNGILHLGNNDLFVENCIVNGFTNTGVYFTSGTTPNFFVADSTIRNNGVIGIRWQGSSPGRGVIDHCRLEGNGGNGLYIQGGGNFTVRNTVAARNGDHGFLVEADGASLDITDSAAANNGGAGFFAYSTGTSGANMHLERCLTSSNSSGIAAGGNLGTGTVRVSNAVITNNTFVGVSSQPGGSIQSRGNNTLESNANNNTFSASYTAK